MRLLGTSRYLCFFVVLLLSNLSLADNPTSFPTVNRLVEESQRMFAGERYPEALDYALSAVKLAENKSKDLYNQDIIDPLINLAFIQEKLQLDIKATKSYERVIDLIERDGGAFDVRLVQPINHVGQLLQKNNKHEQAIKLFRRSQHISHRDKGVYNPDQISALNLMTNSYLLTGELDKANTAQNFRYLINRHKYGTNSIAGVPSMIELAKFKSMLMMYNDAWLLYAEAIQITERAFGNNHLSLVNLLLGLATTMQNQLTLEGYQQIKSIQFNFTDVVYNSHPSSTKLQKIRLSPKKSNAREAFDALSRAIQIVDHNKEKISLADRIAVYVSFGDLCMITRKKRSQGLAMYRRAIQLLDAENNMQELKQHYFGKPKRLQYNKPRLMADTADEYASYDIIFIEVSFTVLANGTIRDVNIIISSAPTFIRARFKKEIRKAIYRPQFVNGEPVPTTAYLREEFTSIFLENN